MTATFAALVAAHVLADFVLQTRWMVARKRHPGVLLLHGAIVLLTAQATLGLAAAPALLAVALAHVVIDAVKARATPGPGAFLADQSAHLAVLAAVAVWQPGLWQAGLWADLPAPWPGAILHGLAGLVVDRLAQIAAQHGDAGGLPRAEANSIAGLPALNSGDHLPGEEPL